MWSYQRKLLVYNVGSAYDATAEKTSNPAI